MVRCASLHPLPAVGLLQPSRPQPGQLHQLLPLGTISCTRPPTTPPATCRPCGGAPIGNPKGRRAVGTTRSALDTAGAGARRRSAPPRRSKVWLLEEGTARRADADRGGRHGTYILNSKDLRAIEHAAPGRKDRRRSAEDRGPHQEPTTSPAPPRATGARSTMRVAGRLFDPRLLGELEAWPAAATPTASISAIPPPAPEPPARLPGIRAQPAGGEVVGWDARGLLRSRVRTASASATGWSSCSRAATPRRCWSGCSAPPARAIQRVPGSGWRLAGAAGGCRTGATLLHRALSEA